MQLFGKKDGKLLRSAAQAEKDEDISIQMYDGRFSAKVTSPAKRNDNHD